MDRIPASVVVCYNQANRNAFAAYAALTKFRFFNKPTGFMHDPEIARLIIATGDASDEKTRNADLRDTYRRLRQQTLDIPLVNVDTPYAASKTLPKWDPGSIMYDLNLDELISQ